MHSSKDSLTFGPRPPHCGDYGEDSYACGCGTLCSKVLWLSASAVPYEWVDACRCTSAVQ